MPPIPSQLLLSIVYLYRDQESARNNTSGGGTGFIVAIDSPQERYRHKYIVTNAHVIEHGFPAPRINTIHGGVDALPLTVSDWYLHKNHDDVAVAPITLPDAYQYKAVGEKMMVHRRIIDELEIAPGADVLMVGRFGGHPGTKVVLPSMRFGNIAMMPIEPVRQDREFPDENGDVKPFFQESYIVEMRSIAGFSGSPVFVYNPGIYPVYGNQRSITIPRDPFMMLLGIDWGHLPSAGISNANICGVVPAWKLHELLFDDERIKKMREDEDKRIEEESLVIGGVTDTLQQDDAEDVFTEEDFMDALRKASASKSKTDNSKETD